MGIVDFTRRTLEKSPFSISSVLTRVSSELAKKAFVSFYMEIKERQTL